ncbi:class I SAM-dependent methyltransferase [Pseudomonas urmiensis]|jgi:2-polyprenyl-3-methyl-5-hydroxy-6-metoxy-1,4-benzoquinol methylase|uniref:Class I SAM-dependent methyltransferase n=1 Tax=Pseudomonas urmiensis TaxID=2745493 RepID=A0A923G1J0_9PSED|nr:class I SAM-dependent methyltransferase [Pseudomonas urmiensis]MBV4535151.1 class I SAM-dependent methyltransferase [Pseudomonas urmiensis]
MNNTLDTYIAAYSDSFGYAYDNNIMLNWYPRRIMQLCGPQLSLLELGIGHGFSTQRFSSYFRTHTVIDGSASVIAQFQEQYPDCPAHIIESYFETFETEQRFDLIVMGFVLEHVQDPQQVLRKFKQYLAPGGRCFVLVPNAQSLHRRFGHAAGLLDDMMTLGAGDHQLGHLRAYSLATLTEELEQAGLRVVRKEGLFLKPFMTSQMRSLNLSDNITTAMCTVAIDYPELSCALMLEATLADQ